MAGRSEGPYSPSPFGRALGKGSEFRVRPRIVLVHRLHGLTRFRKPGKQTRTRRQAHLRLGKLFELFLCNLRDLWITMAVAQSPSADSYY
jgi:hypothetical protein